MAQEASFGLSRSNTSHPRLNLVTAIGYRKGADGELAACHEYQYDALMRPIQQRDSWDTGAPVTVRDFTYNSRSELVEDRISLGGSFSYRYDNIGNRKTARELEEAFSYESNQLNQYADIAGGGDFTSVYDAGYDSQGKRFEKKVTVNGAASGHSWFLYRGYLQVAELDLTHSEPLLVKSYL